MQIEVALLCNTQVFLAVLLFCTAFFVSRWKGKIMSRKWSLKIKYEHFVNISQTTQKVGSLSCKLESDDRKEVV